MNQNAVKHLSDVFRRCSSFALVVVHMTMTIKKIFWI